MKESLLTNQVLRKRRGVRYVWGNYFETRPAHRVTETVFRVQYRQKIWRDWLLYEIAPQVSFPRDNDFDFTPGISFKLEIEFGFLDKKSGVL